jgi:hypothetical protein
MKLHNVRDEWTSPASQAVIEHVAERLRERNIEVTIVDDGDAAREAVLARIPAGAEVHSAKSKTLQDTGIFDALHEAGRFDALRPRYLKMDRQIQAREIRKLIGAPDFMVGSVNALTEDGILVATSASGSQIGPYANTAGKVILVVGSQKIVPDLETALRRLHDYALPWENEQIRNAMNRDSFVGKTLLIEREWVDGRITLILVRQPVGV